MRDVSFRYDDVWVLERINLDVRARDFACVIGPNGGGKTTLIKLLLGLLHPKHGTIRVLGQPPSRACSRIGYMPQHANLDPQFPVSVRDVVLMGRLGKGRLFGRYSAQDREIALQSLQEVNLAEVINRPFADLSGGQRQRVLIARALACEPELLLFDEPTANLDPAVQESLYSLLSRLNERLTVVIVSHDVGFVPAYCRTAICVNRSVHVHPTGELTHQRVSDVYGQKVRIVQHSPGLSSGGPPSGGAAAANVEAAAAQGSEATSQEADPSGACRADCDCHSQAEEES